jgi:hypothetical protein
MSAAIIETGRRAIGTCLTGPEKVPFFYFEEIFMIYNILESWVKILYGLIGSSFIIL